MQIVVERIDIVRNRDIGAGRVAFIEAGHLVEDEGRVRRRARHDPGLIERGGEGDHAPARAASIGRLDAGDAAQRRRLTDRSAGVARRGRRAQSCSHRRRRTARGTARHAGRVPGIPDRAIPARLVARPHGELVHVGLAEHHGAGRRQPLDDGRVIGRDEVVEHPRTATGLQTLGTEDVLVRDRDAGQRPGLAGSERLVGTLGRRERRFGRHRDEGVQRRIEPRDALQIMPGQLNAGIGPQPQIGGHLSDRFVLHQSMTFGTR